jgi:uncharacterized SAM-binding protein YcdF (DUF218 family)
MFFATAKTIWSLLAPTNALLILLLFGLIATCFRRHSVLGKLISTVSAVIFAVCAVAPVGDWLLRPLEAPFSPFPKTGGAITGIVLLGGGERLAAAGTLSRAQPNEAADRLFEAARLAQAYPQARVIVTGGMTTTRSNLADADVMAALLSELGVESNRIERERQARDTYENAVYARLLARPQPGEQWLLVTSAFHMRRALGAFRRAGFEITPAPADWRQSVPGEGGSWSASANLASVDLAAKEYVGLLAYWIRGRASSLFPAP